MNEYERQWQELKTGRHPLTCSCVDCTDARLIRRGIKKPPPNPEPTEKERKEKAGAIAERARQKDEIAKQQERQRQLERESAKKQAEQVESNRASKLRQQRRQAEHEAAQRQAKEERQPRETPAEKAVKEAMARQGIEDLYKSYNVRKTAHPSPSCTCVQCNNERLAKLQSASIVQENETNKVMLAAIATLAAIFIGLGTIAATGFDLAGWIQDWILFFQWKFGIWP